MAGKFTRRKFIEIDLSDPFFDSLKRDYPEFSDWFHTKASEGREALVFNDEQGLGAFVSLKLEKEPLYLNEVTFPPIPRLKICTLRLAERFRGQRLGEGAMGLILWEWQRTKAEEIYVTVFPEHKDLILNLERFGFQLAGSNKRGERLYLRNRKYIDHTDPYKSFPFISPTFKKGGYLIVADTYHDTLFPYSELKNTIQEQLEIDAANGVSKVYIGQQWQVHYNIGEPIFIYRKYTGLSSKPRYKSCLTSYCVATNILTVKRHGHALVSFNEFCSAASNKSVFSQNDLFVKYQQDNNLTVIQLLYYGYFGSGNNINMDWLDNNGLWSSPGCYPANVQLTPQQCARIWNEGGVDIDNLLL